MALIHTNPAQVVADAISAQRKLLQGSISFNLKAKVRNRVTTTQGTVDYVKGSSATLRLTETTPDHRSDRVYRVRGKEYYAYDFYSDESIHRWVPPDLSLTKRLAFVLGAVPDPAKVAIDPEWVAGFLKSLPNLRKYAATTSKTGPILTYRAPHGLSTMKLVFNPSGCLSGFYSTNGASSFAWNVVYSKGKHHMQIPTGIEVNVFSDHQPPPKFATQEARTTYMAASRAFRRLKDSKVVVMRPDKRVVIYWDRGKIRQNGSNSTWVYDGKTLGVSVGGKFYRGKASHADALDYLAFLANGEDSLARSFLLRSNLLDSFVSSADTVQIKGKVVVDGVPATIVQVTGTGRRSSVVVRNTDHLIASAQTDTFGTNGRVAFHDECMYHYLPFSPNAALFTLRPGSNSKSKPLPKNAIQMGSKYVHPELQYEYRNRG